MLVTFSVDFKAAQRTIALNPVVSATYTTMALLGSSVWRVACMLTMGTARGSLGAAEGLADGTREGF